MWTFERTHTFMGVHMHPSVIFSAESFRTMRTYKTVVSCMRADVFAEFFVILEDFIAIFTYQFLGNGNSDTFGCYPGRFYYDILCNISVNFYNVVTESFSIFIRSSAYCTKRISFLWFRYLYLFFPPAFPGYWVVYLYFFINISYRFAIILLVVLEFE